MKPLTALVARMLVLAALIIAVSAYWLPEPEVLVTAVVVLAFGILLEST